MELKVIGKKGQIETLRITQEDVNKIKSKRFWKGYKSHMLTSNSYYEALQVVTGDKKLKDINYGQETLFEVHRLIKGF